MRSYVPLVARTLLGLIFVMSAFSKITGFEGTQQYMASEGMPATAFFLVAATIVELLGGLSVILGAWARAGATALFLFLIPATLIFHTDFSQQTQMIMFLKNMSIMGGLLLLIAYGSGRYSIQSIE
ncbi:MAG: DoxX family protein [Bacteroidetes bacterium SW_9_63_38]|nr:MAG: DoxX family protein [Bacteroidetes bacterium SW_9_63_38]